MPRKYHRPPDTTTKRRKSRKTVIPYEFEAPPESAADSSDSASEDSPEASAAPAATATLEREPLRGGMSGKAERHVTVDYGYVRGEVIRIAAIIGFLVIALVVTSIFR